MTNLSRLIGCDTETLAKAVSEIKMIGIGNVTCNGDVTNCNTFVTVINRRMYKEDKDRINTKMRVQKHRTNKTCNSGCNADVTVASSTSSSSTKVLNNKRYVGVTTPLSQIFEKIEGSFTAEELKLKQDFLDYWTEKSDGGKKERWQKEKVFDPARRFRTFVKNNERWNRNNQRGKQVDIFQNAPVETCGVLIDGKPSQFTEAEREAARKMLENESKVKGGVTV